MVAHGRLIVNCPNTAHGPTSLENVRHHAARGRGRVRACGEDATAFVLEVRDVRARQVRVAQSLTLDKIAPLWTAIPAVGGDLRR